MTNLNLLNQYIAKSGLKLNYIAEQLFISRYALYHKLIGKSDFRQNEIKRLCDLLKIPAQDRLKIFLA